MQDLQPEKKTTTKGARADIKDKADENDERRDADMDKAHINDIKAMTKDSPTWRKVLTVVSHSKSEVTTPT